MTVLRKVFFWKLLMAAFFAQLFAGGFASFSWAAVAESPLFIGGQVPPLNLLVMGRDHKLYYEAYNDASDLDGDGTLDVGYKPNDIDYFGYFDSTTCYTYDSTDNRFDPTSTAADKTVSGVTYKKTCSGTSEWSGDFLNYLTTSRLDALRKVLYGGTRSTDDADQTSGSFMTVLERSHVPQNAHSWGKEYSSLAHDGYDIRDYTPLDLPASGTRHLFANVTLQGTSEPLLRVLNDSRYRIWEWVSIERPVAGLECDGETTSRQACATGATTVKEIIPSSYFSSITQTIYSTYDSTTLSGPGDATDYASMDALETAYAGSSSSPLAIQTLSNLDGDYNDDYFLNIMEGKIIVPYTGSYTFYIDGDDAVEFSIDTNSDGFAANDVVVAWYGGHSASGSSTSHSATVTLSAGVYEFKFRHQEETGSASWGLYWEYPVPASAIVDYSVRAQVCNSSYLEDNCKAYNDGTYTYYKPTGLLQDYGEDDQMLFGLLTGSYTNNTQGGVLRKAVSSFSNEVNPATGQFTSVDGIVKTIDNLKTTNFNSSYAYDNCGWITTRAMYNGECNDWGNPVAEMMYEGLRYFAGKAAPTSDYAIASSGNLDATLGLPLATWDDPFNTYPVCSKAFELVISDINPSYDSDMLPGAYSNFSSSTPSDAISGLDVEDLGDTIWNHEYGGTESVFIGQSGTTYDNAPTAKDVTSFGTIRGLAPEEPTKRGSYYPASVAYYGLMNDLNPATDDQTVSTFSVALASPLPEIKIPVGGSTITLVPFAKSVAGDGISASSGSFQPTDTIVDFYVEELTSTSGVFRINFEDVEQGADHDMDAIVEYSYQVDTNNNTVTISLDSQYAAGGITQHMGYIISGTTEDGIYLEVKDVGGANIDYFLDTPPGEAPGGNWNDGVDLPLQASRTFTPANNTSSAFFLKDPLWYAAKYGLFDETVTGATKNSLPDSVEYDKDADGDPDNYFLVTNALTLSDQLSKAFDDIVGVQTSAASVATNSTRLNTDSFVYLATFNTETWAGELTAYPLNADGTLDPAEWKAGELLTNMTAPANNRNIYTYSEDSATSTYVGKTFEWANLDASQQAALNTDYSGSPDSNGSLRVAYLRGDTSQEQQNGGIFRDRNALLGDIINSDPWYVGTQNYGYAQLPGTEGTDYLAYRSSSAYLNRTEVLYVGANDGMLHAFDAGKRDTSNSQSGGDELFAYVPNGVYDKLSGLTDPGYVHTYYVDGPPRATDAYLDLDNNGIYEWETILVGSLGAGGKGIFALRVTDPDNFTADDVLWEISPSTTGYAELGYVLDQPFIVRMANGQFCAVFGNGYEGTSGKAVLYVADLTDGSLIASIDVGGTNNGLSGVAPIDYDSGVQDSIVDYVYAGDLQGNLWKFDVTDNTPSNWVSAYGTDPLFIAKDSSGNLQPITARPEVAKATASTADSDNVMVFFGTGKYFETGDNVVDDPADPNDPYVQTMYGIYDSGLEVAVTDRSDTKFRLVEQEILVETTVSGNDVRALSDYPVDYSASGKDRGWYLDLVSPVNGIEGERVVERAQAYSGYLIYVTLIPSDDICAFGGDSWTMVVDPETGGALSENIFDANNDDNYDSADEVTDSSGNSHVVSSVKSNSGIISAPAIVTAGDKIHLLTTGTDPDGFNDEQIKGSGNSSGRGSWRQLR